TFIIVTTMISIS
ncbi:hypothetical protein VCHC17A1_4050B, partial [Vibrio cholerae HC-17A1]